MTLQQFLEQLDTAPQKIQFEETMAVIDGHYIFTETAFRNGDCDNESGQNNGSCKIFAFGELNGLSEAKTLACFGQYYREDVLMNPEGEDHQNIRNFIKTGWQAVSFESQPLTLK